MTVPVVKEMQVLRNYLDRHKISWEDDSECFSYAEDYWTCRTHFWYGGHFYSVINGVNTYGGFTRKPAENLGLLELYTDWLPDVVPYCRARTIERIMEGTLQC